MNSPMDLRLLLPEKSKGTPTANKGKEAEQRKGERKQTLEDAAHVRLLLWC